MDRDDLSIINQSDQSKLLSRIKNHRNSSQGSINHYWGKSLVIPKIDESFCSWIFRQSWVFNITPNRLIKSEKEYWLRNEGLNLCFPEGKYNFSKLDLISLDKEFILTLKKRGLDLDVFHLQVDPSPWIDDFDQKEKQASALKPFFHLNLRYCPICWRDEETRYFRKMWRFRFIVVCLEHGFPLLNSCPFCNEILYPSENLGYIKLDWLINCRNCGKSLVKNDYKGNGELIRFQTKIYRSLLSERMQYYPFNFHKFWNSYRAALSWKSSSDCYWKLNTLDTIFGKIRKSSKLLVCYNCVETFKSVSALQDHIWTCVKDRLCPYCNRSHFETKTTYDKHVWACETDHKCPICDKRGFKSKSSYDDHLWICKAKPVCSECGKTSFKYKSHYEDHVWACKNRPVCFKCKKNDFKTRTGYNKHISVCGQQLVCSFCGHGGFKSKTSYYDHIWACKNKPSCLICKKTGFKTKSSYKSHEWACKENPICLYCKKTGFRTKNGYRNHLKLCKSKFGK